MTITIEPKNDFQETLYSDLKKLVSEGDGEFLTKDYPVENHPNLMYRVFTYSLPKHSDFMKPNALNCRGTMFLVDKETDKAQLISLPMEKFFSLGEGGAEDSKFKISDAKYAYLKEDGSLITSYICPFEKIVKFKSKNMPTYLNYEIVFKSVPTELIKEIESLYNDFVCVDLELTTPENRVMIEYASYNVHVLKARSLLTGSYVDIRSDEFKHQYPNIAEHLVKEVPVSSVDINRKDIEGYVLEMPNGNMMKLKTIPYLSIVAVISIQDRSKEAEYLYKAALDEVLDEVRSLHVYRAVSPNYPLKEILTRVDLVEAYAAKTYHSFVQEVEKLHEENKHLDRGDYARKFKDQKELLPILMEKYLGREVDYKKMAVKLFAKKALN